MSVRSERDYQSFEEIGPSEWARRVTLTGTFLQGVSFDEMQATYPSSTVEVYTYKKAAATVATLTVTYVAADKEQVLSVVKT